MNPHQTEQKHPWDEKKLIFVTGKGGVGKSLIAAGLAQHLALQGKRVLLVEMGENSYAESFWQISPNASKWKPKYDMVLWNTESCLREYVLHYVKLESLYQLFFENRLMRTLIDVAPGLREIALLGKITSGVRHIGPEVPYDVLVMDTYASGHALSLFRTPAGLQRAIPFGPMGEQSRHIRKVLSEPSTTGYVIVSLLEELPGLESLELAQSLFELLGQKALIVANKVLKIPLSREELQQVGSPFAEHLLRVDGRQTHWKKRLGQASFPQLSQLPDQILQIPLMLQDNNPYELVQGVATALRLQLQLQLQLQTEEQKNV